MWRTKYLPLTKEQRERDVVFSSKLIVTNKDIEPTLHEVFDGEEDQDRHIELLKDVRFFKSMAEDFGFDVIEERRS